MPAQNIECQLALGQIGRYITGDLISTEAVQQLEEHIADCFECQEIVAQRKRAIQAMLGQMNSDRAVVQVNVNPAETTKAKAIEEFADRLRQTQVYGERRAKHLEEPQEEPKKAAPLKDMLLSKPLLYCSGLAVVLIAMSYFSRSALQTFGPNASQMLSSTESQTKTPAPVTPVPVTPVPVQNKTPQPPVSSNATTEKPPVAHPTTTTAPPATKTGANTTNAVKTPGRAVTPPAPARPTPTKPKPAHNAKPTTTVARVKTPAKAPTIRAPKLHVTVHRVRTNASRLRRLRLMRNAAAARRRAHRIRHAKTSAIRVYDAQGQAIK